MSIVNSHFSTITQPVILSYIQDPFRNIPPEALDKIFLVAAAAIVTAPLFIDPTITKIGVFGGVVSYAHTVLHGKSLKEFLTGESVRRFFREERRKSSCTPQCEFNRLFKAPFKEEIVNSLKSKIAEFFFYIWTEVVWHLILAFSSEEKKKYLVNSSISRLEKAFVAIVASQLLIADLWSDDHMDRSKYEQVKLIFHGIFYRTLEMRFTSLSLDFFSRLCGEIFKARSRQEQLKLLLKGVFDKTIDAHRGLLSAIIAHMIHNVACTYFPCVKPVYK